MARRSLQASAEGIQAIKKALKRKQGGQTHLAIAVGCSRQTIWSLLQGNPIDCEVFWAVCQELGLNWEDIAVAESPIAEAEVELETIVAVARQQIEPYIQSRCGEMRVLDMRQPVELGSIYTSVNILEKLSRVQGLEVALRGVGSASFERFLLGEVRQKRVPGLEAVEQFAKLMILGKPGAGKTTFLKHLAIECVGGRFQPDRVPIFVTLKEFAETDGQPSLLGYCGQLVSPVQTLLKAGKALILLDGLDEVREVDADRVLRQIRDFARQFGQNPFVITCRIAAHEYTFEQFTEVEIADFDDQQIADFSHKWFHCKDDPVKAERFLQKLKDNEPIRELATNPLLLTLLCFVFEESGDFPSSRADLCEQGIEQLLRKWNPRKRKCEPIYEKLSSDYRKELFSYIAWITFQQEKYFFKQRLLGQLVREFIKNLPGLLPEDLLRLDSNAVIESIELQHGLFVKREWGIYSFSHLTFHEYFTARKIVTSCNPSSADDPILQTLVKHVTEPRWKEVFLLVTEMLESADIFLQLMKREIDFLLAEDEKLQQFLKWVNEKSSSVNASYEYKPAAIRAFYFALDIDRYFKQSFDYERPYERSLDCNIDSTFGGANPNYYMGNQDYHIAVAQSQLSRSFAFKSLASISLYMVIKSSAAARALKLQLAALEEKLPSSSIEREDWREEYNEGENWWQVNGQAWIEQLQQVMIEHRNIGHDWQFSDEQNQLLEQYYDANQLLVKCLNLPDIFVSPKVRQEIEETLLLPWEEIIDEELTQDG